MGLRHGCSLATLVITTSNLVMDKAHFGLIGLGVMGENLVLNAERNGFSSVVYNRTYAKTEEFLQGRGAGKQIIGATSLEDFVAKLQRPRRILMMIKAGDPIDAMIQQMAPLLEEGDLLIDGGNSLYTDTDELGEDDKVINTICNKLFEDSRDLYPEPEYNSNGDLVYEPPLLDEIWLTEPKRCKCKARLQD